jgi:hypothetical protein
MASNPVDAAGAATVQDKQDRNIEESAEIAQQFLTGITRLGMDLKLEQVQAVMLFGLFARKCVDVRVKAGAPRDVATMDLMTSFLKGMGMDMVIEPADPDEVAELGERLKERRGSLQ